LHESQICNTPLYDPTERKLPFLDQHSEVTLSFEPKSVNFTTFPFMALHKYTVEPNPTARVF